MNIYIIFIFKDRMNVYRIIILAMNILHYIHINRQNERFYAIYYISYEYIPYYYISYEYIKLYAYL